VREFKRSAGLGRFSGYGVESYQYLAMSYLQLEDPENAIKAYRQAIQLDPTRDDSHVSLGNLYFAQSRYDDARSEYSEANRINPCNSNRYSLGQAFVELGRYEDAATQFNEIIRSSPLEAGGYFGMGLTYSRQKRFEDAIQQFKEAADRDPELSDAYSEMGYAYADM
jgi:tetratricopeptide (TPR) repeat protein